MKTIVKAIILTAILGVLSQSVASACVSYHWTGATSSDWNDSGNWQEDLFGINGVPDGDDYAIIDKSEYGTASDPILSSATDTPLEVSLRNGANVTIGYDLTTTLLSVRGSGNKLQINSGRKINTSDISLASAGADIELNGAGSIEASDDFIFGAANCKLVNNLTGGLKITDDVTFQLAAGRLENNGIITIGDDLRTANITAANNRVINETGATLSITGDINFQGAVNYIENSGIVNQSGNFTGIDLLCSFENRAGGTWNWMYTGGSPDPDMASVLSSNGTVVYAGSGDQMVLPIAYTNLTISGSGTKQLQGNSAVTGVLTLSAGSLALNDADLIIGSSASISNASSSRYIVANGTGKLIQNGLGAGGRTGDILFPIGASTTSYTPLTINNAGTVDNFSVSLASAIWDNGYSGTPQSSDAVNKTWFIDEEVVGGSDVTLTFQWNDADQLSGFSPLSVKVIHYDGSQWETMAQGAASGSGPYTMSASNISSFSPFGLEGEDGTLPVELLYFKGDMKGDVAVLEWATASELNNDFFTIEKTVDLEEFEEVAVVNGNGTTNEASNYKYHDSQPSGGVSYYRLKQTDFDGTFTYSDIIQINNTSSTDLTEMNMYPVPNKGDYLKLKVAGLPSEKETSILVYNTQGQIVHQQESVIGNYEELTLNFNEKLPIGVYTVRINSATPLVKQFTVR